MGYHQPCIIINAQSWPSQVEIDFVTGLNARENTNNMDGTLVTLDPGHFR